MYRLYDDAGTLLYVGSAYDPEVRCAAHRDKPWWPHVARRSEEWHPTRGHAYAAEMEAIGAEDPRHNQMGTRWWVYPDTPATRQRVLDNRVRGRVQAEAYRLRRRVSEEAKAAGATPSEAWRMEEEAFVDLLDASGLFPAYVARLRQ